MGLKEVKDNYQKLGSKRFMEKWKQGINQISQTTLLKIDIWSLIGGIIGTIIVCVLVLLLTQMPWLMLAFIFSIGLQASQLISKYQQYNIFKQMRELQEQGNVDEIIKEIKKDI